MTNASSFEIITGPKVAFIGDGLVMGEIGRVCVAVWRKQSTRDRFEIQRAKLADMVARHPGQAGFLCVVENTSEPPEAYVRKASADMVTNHGRNLACIGCVSEGSGFRAAITRSVMSGMVVMMQNRAPLKIFESVTNASQWMAQYMQIGPILNFVAGVESLRLRLDLPQ